MTDREKLEEISRIILDPDMVCALESYHIHEGSKLVALSKTAVIGYMKDAFDDIRFILAS